MPVGDIPGWRQGFTDDFGGSSLDKSKWFDYSRQPGGDPAGWWDPSHVVVGDCVVTLRGYRDVAAKPGVFVTGGIGLTSANSGTYGKYLVRMRRDKAMGISAIALLWPRGNSWPPEIDFTRTTPRQPAPPPRCTAVPMATTDVRFPNRSPVMTSASGTPSALNGPAAS